MCDEAGGGVSEPGLKSSGCIHKATSNTNTLDPTAPNRTHTQPRSYNATTQTRFWGFVSCIISFDAISRNPVQPNGTITAANSSARESSLMLSSLRQRVRGWFT